MQYLYYPNYPINFIFWGIPVTDKMKAEIPFCPILEPTYKQFKNFSNYTAKVQKQYRGQVGMVKIIPPKQWISRSSKYDSILNKMIFKNPESQTLYGKKQDYYFMCRNKKHPIMTLQEFREQAQRKQKEISKYKLQPAIEKYFWNIVNTLYQEVYCANVQHTLMDSSSGAWEFGQLKSFFNEIVTEEIGGLNTSFLFVGAWRTFFNWHIEDLDLSAINLLHEGATKVWYAVHPEDRKKFESVLSNFFVDEAIKCPNFMRHKQIFLDPLRLQEAYPSIRISKMYQNQGEISLAFAGGYHCGFNMGFNIAEAVNYGTFDWLERYSKFKGCKCPLQIGVPLEHKEMVDNISKSNYSLIKDKLVNKITSLPAYKKLQEKVEIDEKPDLLFSQATNEQIEAEILKEKVKSINKNKKSVFIAKYNRHFPTEQQMYLECDICKIWRKTSQLLASKFAKRKVKCTQIGFTCKIVSGKLKTKSKTNRLQTSQAKNKKTDKRKTIKKEKKIAKVEPRVTRSQR